MAKDLYQILDVSPDATCEEIKQQYRFLVHAWHPDKFRDPAQKARAEEKIKEINAAYTTLMDSDQRSKYDCEREQLEWVSIAYRPDGGTAGAPDSGSQSGRPSRWPATTTLPHTRGWWLVAGVLLLVLLAGVVNMAWGALPIQEWLQEDPLQAQENPRQTAPSLGLPIPGSAPAALLTPSAGLSPVAVLSYRQLDGVRLPRLASPSEISGGVYARAPALRELAGSRRFEGGMTKYDVSLAPGQPALWIASLCLKDEALLKESWSKVGVHFYLNGEELPVSLFSSHEGPATVDVPGKGAQPAYCRSFYSVLHTWPAGEFILSDELVYEQSLSDGWNTHPAGSSTATEYTIIVK